MTEYNFEHSRVSETVKSLHKDLQSISSLNNDDTESPTMQYPRASTNNARISKFHMDKLMKLHTKYCHHTMSPKNIKSQFKMIMVCKNIRIRQNGKSNFCQKHNSILCKKGQHDK